MFNHTIDECNHVIIDRNRLIEHAVEHIFYGPCQFADIIRFHHAATAFQRMERTSYRGQRFTVILILTVSRPELAQSLGNFFCFLEEDFDDFIVDKIIVGVF